MRILVVGAGAIGGYFGGRLLEAGRDVTFLVRPRRAAQLGKTGLIITSRFGNVSLPAPPTVTADALHEPFDLILLSCKAYDLESAADSFAPAVGTNTAILPLLNGMRHMDYLTERFGGGSVLGGQCQISTTLDAEGRVLHLNDLHFLSFGEPDASTSQRAQAITAALAGARFESKLSNSILQEMWEKWVLIATVAGINCLMRATIGDIVATNAGNLSTALLDECAAIAAAHGFAPSASPLARARAMITTPGSTFAASMLRDIERGAPIEADHIIGDLLHRGPGSSHDHPLLRIAYAHLKAYEARRTRENKVSQAA
jgi:2-dehydropantoate 2-reductase